MFNVGRVCLKIAGRDAGKVAVVVDTVDDKHVLVEGEVRRRKCNVGHLELTDKEVKVSKGASLADVAKALKEVGIEISDKETKKKESKARPTKVRKAKEKPAAPAKEEKKAEPKKVEKKAEAKPEAKKE